MEPEGNSNEGGAGLPTDILKMNPYLTVVILVTGVAGGLALVIGVIFFCKYCVKKRRLPGRDPSFFTPLPADLDINTRSRLCTSRRLESKSEEVRLPLDDEDDGSPERESLRLLDDEEDSLDSCIADYLANGEAQSMDHLPDIPEEEPLTTCEIETTPVTERAETERSPVSPRRVSFQVAPIRQKQANYIRRYTEGDFHHLKSSRIKPPGDSIKAFSLDFDCQRGGERRNHLPGRAARTSLPNPDDLQWHKPLGDDFLHPCGMTVKAQIHIQPAEQSKVAAIEGIKTKDLSPCGQVRLLAPSHLQLRSPRKNSREKGAAETDRDSESKGFVPIPAENSTGFAEPISSEGSEGSGWSAAKGIRRGLAGLSKFHPPPQIEICEKPTPDQETRTGDYRELWQLRTTLEMEDSGSLSSEPDTVIPAEGGRLEGSAQEDGDSQYLEPSDSALSPTDTSAAEADDGKNRLTVVQRYRFNTHGKNDSFEQMFSSISTEESDTSERSKGGDSSGKDSASKLKQMQADSGYTSIEHKNEVSEQQKRYLFASADRDSTSLESCAPALSSESSPIGERPLSSGTDSAVLTESGKDEPLPPNVHGVRRRSDRRTASTKRREFIAEKGEAIFGSFSFPEEESEADSQTITGSVSEKSIGIAADSQSETSERFRGSNRVGRIFRVQGENRLRSYPKGRDYSIDEKTDALFKEFMRSDAMFDAPSSRRSRPPRNRRFQLHHKQHSDSLLDPTRKLVDASSSPDVRSSSFDHRGESAKERLTHLLPGSNSSRKLSPQDSVEEDYLRKESGKIWGQSQPPPRKRDLEELPSKDREPPGRREHSEEGRSSAQASQRLDLEDVSCRPSAFRCVKKSPKLKRSHVSIATDDEGSSDKPRVHEEQAPMSKGKIISQTTLVRPTAIHPKESIPTFHGGAGHRESPRNSCHYSSKGELRDEAHRHRETYPSGGSEPPPHRRGRSPGRDRSPWRSPQTPTATQEGEYADKRAKSPLRMHSTGSSQGSAEWSDDRGFLSVPSKDHLDRPHSASSLLRLQREAASPQFERHYSDETYDAPRRDRSIDYDSKLDSEREQRGSSGRLHPLRCNPGRHIRPATVRTSSETNILESRDGQKRNRAQDLRRQHYGRAHSALDVFAANKPPQASSKDLLRPRPTPERLSVRSITLDSPSSPGAVPKERRHPLDVHKDERRHPLDCHKDERKHPLDVCKQERKHPLEGLKDDRKGLKEERKHPLEGYKEKHKDSTAPLRW